MVIKNMFVKEAIKRMIIENGKTMYSLSKEMGYKNDSTVRNIIEKRNINLKTLKRFCDNLGYSIFLVRKDENNLDNAMQLEYEEDLKDEGNWY